MKIKAKLSEKTKQELRGQDGRDGANGKDGRNGIDGKNGLDGRDGINPSVEEITSLVLENIPEPVNGSPDTGLDIVQKINSLPTLVNDTKIHIDHIYGLDFRIPSQQSILNLIRENSSSGLDTTAGDLRYLKLDASNDPLTGHLDIFETNAGHSYESLSLSVNANTAGTDPVIVVNRSYGSVATVKGPGIRFQSIDPTIGTTPSANSPGLQAESTGLTNWTAFEIDSALFGIMNFQMGGYSISQMNFFPSVPDATGASIFYQYQGDFSSGSGYDAWTLRAEGITGLGSNFIIGSTYHLTFTTPNVAGSSPASPYRAANTSDYCFKFTGKTSINIPTGTTAQDNMLELSAQTYRLNGSLTTAATFYINNAPSKASGAGTLTNAYSIFVDAGTSRFDGGILMGGLTGVTASATTGGVLTLAGTGNTNNENLTLDFEGTANQVTINTGTGVNKVVFTGMEVECATINTGNGAVELAAGTYTPTLTNGTNVAASTAYQCQYMRVGQTVTVSGKVDIDLTAVGVYELGVSLPVASNFGATEDCAGTAVGTTTTPGASDLMWVMADTTNDRASLNGNDNDTANHTHYFHFTYQVI